MKKTLMTALAACMLFVAGLQTGSAAVFYDVTVTYEGGYVYSFDMGFANSVGNKTLADLGGDFGDETLTRNGVNIPLLADVPTGGLFFNPATLVLFFSTNDVFKEIGTPVGVFGSFESNAGMSFFEVPGVATNYAPLSIRVVQQTEELPLPSTLWLLVAGLLPALRLGSKAALRRRVVRQDSLPTA